MTIPAGPRHGCCAVCDKGPSDGVSVYRMNAKGQPGLWACNEHKDQFDGRVDPEILEITRALEGKKS